jgi:acyl carrier protein
VILAPSPASSEERIPMPENITFEAVAERIAALMNVPAGLLTPETELRSVATESLLMVELVIDLQEEFDVVFTQADLRWARTLADLVGLLRGESHAVQE